jgi:hypothetical protein
MLKRSKKLLEKYLPYVLARKETSHKRWVSVVLTGIVIERNRLPEYARPLAAVASDFLRGEYPDGGLIALEYVICAPQKTLDGSDAGYRERSQVNVHVHALVYGGFKNLENFQKRWASYLAAARLVHMTEIGCTEGRRWTWLRFAKRVKNALRYVLKHVAKGIGLSDEEVEQLKRQKYVRSWGFLYGVKERCYDLVCADCLVSCCVVFDESFISKEEPPDGRPLRVIRVPKPPPLCYNSSSSVR